MCGKTVLLSLAVVACQLLVNAVWGQRVYFSLGLTVITTNNTEVLITDIGEDVPGGLPRLTCHTDLTRCCRNMDTGGQGGRGAWYYPDGRMVQNNADSIVAGEGFYRVRNAPQVVRLGRRDSIMPLVLSPTGHYCCVIPTTGGEMTFCVNIATNTVYFSLGLTVITTNNTEVLITDIGEYAPDGLPSLTCHTDLTRCCRNRDTGGQGGRGAWYYPDGSAVQNSYGSMAAGEGFYRVRNAPQVVRLARRVSIMHPVLSPTGHYCCVIPTTVGEMTFCVNIVVCPSLTVLTKGMISYSDPTLGVGSVATSGCNSGYEPSSSENTRTCQANGNWTGSDLSCKVVCPSLGMPTNGRISYSDPTLGVGSVATFGCNSGYELSSNENTRTCQANGYWTGSDLSCKVVCPSLTVPTNGMISYSDPTLGVGSVATFVCNSGYELSSNENTRTCQANGTWSGSDLSCKAGCGEPAAPVNGQVVTPMGTAPGSFANYECNVGYNLMGFSTRFCLLTGWVPEVPTCQIIDCGQLPAPASGQVHTSPSTTYNSVATYSCDSGYMLNEETSRACQTNGTWSGSQPECLPVVCTNLTDPSNGRVTADGTTFLSTATYTCDRGYRLIGDNTRTCGTGGQWSSYQPRCEPVDCGSLTHPTNGRVNTLAGTVFMSVARYSCNVGYTLPGSAYGVCNENGTWSPQPLPVCQIVDCGALYDPTNGQVSTLHGTTYNRVATYTCVKGYELVGTVSRTCTASGLWSSSTPTCNPVNCGPLQDPKNGHVDTSQGTLFTNTALYSCDSGHNLTGCSSASCLSTGEWSCDPPFCADNVMIQLKFGPTQRCVEWTETKVKQMYKLMHSSVLSAIQSGGHVIPRENIQQGYFSCYKSTTETTYRTTITGTERVSAVDYAGLIQEWVESGVTTRVQWYVIKIDKNCPVSIMSMDEEECE